ncbi:MAG: hypothetical protein JRI25_05070 [Deltaproteobacteria bacterium]|nr:hypothetical protein [Deltaproteobacteria bacterium]MBW2253953.1 hypothetical protein [Deltaproteobacteria bacterium]
MSNETATSTTALMSVILGGIGVLFVLMGCFFGPFGCFGTVLSGAGLVLGMLELRKIRAGESDEGNRALSTAGAGLGGGGCAMSALIWLCISGFVVLYVVFVVIAVVLGN